MDRMKGKVCIITGAANGMGLFATRLFLQEGAKVMAIDKNAEAMEKNIAAIDNENLIYYVMDIGDEAAWKIAVEKTVERFGEINVLVNSAGFSRRVKLMDTTLETWQGAMSDNVVGQWLGIREVIPHMQKAGGGSIVNCGSNTALQGGDIDATYSSCKGALRALTKNVAMAFGKDKIRCNCVHPGPTLTSDCWQYDPNMTVDMLGYAFKAMIPLPPHAGEAIDIAYAYLFLASDESKFINGIDLPVDGGWSAGFIPIQ